MIGSILGIVASLAGSIAIDVDTAKRFNIKLENYGYKQTDKKLPPEEMVARIGRFALCHAIPIVNIAYSAYVAGTLNSVDKVKETISKLEENGEIEKITENPDGTPYREPINLEVDVPLFEEKEVINHLKGIVSKPFVRKRTRK